MPRSTDTRAVKDRAEGLVRAGKLDKALTAFAEVLAAEPEDDVALMRMADLCRRLGRKAEAVRYFGQAAHVLAKKGFLVKAIAACKVVLEIDPAHAATQQMLASFYAQKGGASPRPTRTATDQPLEVADADVVEVVEPVLPRIPLFSDLPHDAFVSLVEHLQTLDVAADALIIREGGVDDAMFVIAAGKVKVSRRAGQPDEQVLAYLEEGAFFGEMALLSSAPRSATVSAITDAQLLVISRDVLTRVTRAFPAVEQTLQRFYRERLIANLLATSPLFAALDRPQQEQLARAFQTRDFATGEVVLTQGRPGDGLYVVLAGGVSVTQQVDGKSIALAELREGDVFGEMELIDRQPAVATVRVSRPSILIRLPTTAFVEFATAYPHLLAHISEISQVRAQQNRALAGAAPGTTGMPLV